jgi:anti-sigma factor RsiW
VADARWRISVTPPDWGHGHLSLEAIVAFVDGELAPGPHARASQHLGQCPECASQVSAQAQARKALRTAGGPCLPSALLSSLRAIPRDTELPSPPPGLAMTADGQLVSVVRPERTRSVEPQRGFRTDIATPHHHSPRPARPSSSRHRLRVGTGIAVSGLALGALVFGTSGTAPSAPAPPTPAPTADRGLTGGSAYTGGGSPGVLDARFELGSTGPGPAAPAVER